MRILVSNDDGIRARGLKVLEAIAKELSDDVWVVAPETEQSGAGHSLTLHRPVRVRRISARRLAIDGTPTDCVLLAINTLIPGPPPDLVLSGVNRGSNVADDVTYSGTIAAAMEATILGVPAIALSQEYGDPARVKWGTVRHHAPDVLPDQHRSPLPERPLGRRPVGQGGHPPVPDHPHHPDPRELHGSLNGQHYSLVMGFR